nr:hypothetical protein [uncultured Gemmiger sp.]
MLTFEAGSLGVPFTAARLCMSMIGINFIAAIMNGTLSQKDKAAIYEKNTERGENRHGTKMVSGH